MNVYAKAVKQIFGSLNAVVMCAESGMQTISEYVQSSPFLLNLSLTASPSYRVSSFRAQEPTPPLRSKVMRRTK